MAKRLFFVIPHYTVKANSSILLNREARKELQGIAVYCHTESCFSGRSISITNHL
jgi:hypothetical protein